MHYRPTQSLIPSAHSSVLFSYTVQSPVLSSSFPYARSTQSPVLTYPPPKQSRSRGPAFRASSTEMAGLERYWSRWAVRFGSGSAQRVPGWSRR
eukprot:2518496-Rhodomonas_salina.2